MQAITNLKRNIGAARARWNAAHALNRNAKWDHTHLVRAGRALTDCDFARTQPQLQQQGGGCNVSLQPRFLGIADRQ